MRRPTLPAPRRRRRTKNWLGRTRPASAPSWDPPLGSHLGVIWPNLAHSGGETLPQVSKNFPSGNKPPDGKGKSRCGLTVELTVETLSSRLIILERIRFFRPFSTDGEFVAGPLTPPFAAATQASRNLRLRVRERYIRVTLVALAEY
eukprot:1184527-Prorocentrum_minimum.AAC.3